MMLSGYVGLTLMATVFLAIGTLISSFTDNVVIAYVGTLFALLAAVHDRLARETWPPGRLGR